MGRDVPLLARGQVRYRSGSACRWRGKHRFLEMSASVRVFAAFEWNMVRTAVLAFFLCVGPPGHLAAETGYEAWLRYPAIHKVATRGSYRVLPRNVVKLGSGLILDSAQSELIRGVHGMLGVELKSVPKTDVDSVIVLG